MRCPWSGRRPQARAAQQRDFEGGLQQTGSAANVAAANYHGALAALELAQLNLAHATVRAPVAGYVTHLRLRPGDYATAGVTTVAVIDAQSFLGSGLF
nr:FusE-MFP/HlyD family membrane fusion protein [Raoultella sp. NCTC 9187]